MDFPAVVSFTVTNACNLRCQMCGQWSTDGYVRTGQGRHGRPLTANEWCRLADECAGHGVTSILLRGGEPFMLPGIDRLIEHLHSLGMYVSIDTNGTRLGDFAALLVELGRIHVTVSIDGTEPVHDAVRGVHGCFRQIATQLARLTELDHGQPQRVSRSICFTISPWSLPSLGELPAVARQLGVGTICIVPYCYLSLAAGEQWQRELRDLLGQVAFAWRGFVHERSGVEAAEFAAQHERFTASLGELTSYPYLPLTGEEYRAWFADSALPVGSPACSNVERLIDIQPTGDANFCVDLPDGSLGNVRQQSIAEIWKGEPARRFRERRRERPLAACARCVARHMADQRGESA